METRTLTPELLHKMDAYWRAANYLSVGQIYLYDNSRLDRPGSGRDRPLPTSERWDIALHSY